MPDELVVAVSPTYVAMKGTEQKPSRCVALLGEIGQAVRCTQYECRSTPCREFEASWQGGQANEACDAARAAYGLAPIEPNVSPDRVA